MLLGPQAASHFLRNLAARDAVEDHLLEGHCDLCGVCRRGSKAIVGRDEILENQSFQHFPIMHVAVFYRVGKSFLQRRPEAHYQRIEVVPCQLLNGLSVDFRAREAGNTREHDFDDGRFL